MVEASKPKRVSRKIKVSTACEDGLSIEVAETKAQLWLQENRSAIDAWNEHFEGNGLPLADFRQF